MENRNIFGYHHIFITVALVLVKWLASKAINIYIFSMYKYADNHNNENIFVTSNFPVNCLNVFYLLLSPGAI